MPIVDHAPIRRRSVPAGAASDDLLASLCSGDLDAVVLEGAIDPAEVAVVSAALQAGLPEISIQQRDHHDSGRPQVGVLGLAVSPSDLWPAGPVPDEYFPAAESFRAICAGLLPSAPPIYERVAALLSSMSPKPVQLARDHHGRRYGSCTLRKIPPDCGLPPHCENDYMTIAIYQPLSAELELQLQMSFVLLLQEPEEGHLAMYEWAWQKEERADPEMLPAPAAIPMRAGDLVVFSSGRVLHSVGPVRGARTRWTLGGFMAPRRDGEGYWYWA